MRRKELFRWCPRCGTRADAPPAQPAPPGHEDPFRCGNCGLVYFFNPAAAAAVFISDATGRVLFIRRAKDPGKGKLAVPGGFVDMRETAEKGLCREVLEEVGLELNEVRYLCSCPNDYPYKDVTYPVLDLYFTSRVKGETRAAALDDVESFTWLDPAGVNPDELAFASLREALAQYLRICLVLPLPCA